MTNKPLFVTADNLDTNYFEIDQNNKKIKLKKSVKGLELEDTNLVLVNEDGTKKKLDLTPLLSLDKYLNLATLNDGKLKFTVTNGDAVEVDVSDLAKVKTDSTATITLAGLGTEANKLTANVILNTDPDNSLVSTGTGLKVVVKDVLVLHDAFGDEIRLTDALTK